MRLAQVKWEERASTKPFGTPLPLAPSSVSEMIGNYFAPIGNWLGKYADVPVHETKLSHLVGATARGVRKVSRTREWSLSKTAR